MSRGLGDVYKRQKCHSSDIVIVKGQKTNYAKGNVIFTGATIFSAAIVDRFVCCNCGFVEEWVDNPQDLQKIRIKHGRTS